MPKNILFLILLFLAVTFTASNIRIKFAITSYSLTLYVPDGYKTIQEAINAAEAGDTIIVEPGNYTENVLVNKTVSLIGRERDKTIIDGGYSLSVFRVISNNVKIKELIAKICFKDQNHFQNFIDILSIVRHFLSHNYTEKVVLKRWDMKKDSTIVELKRRHNDGVISFKYNGAEYFREIYKESNFQIDIAFNLSNAVIGNSLFDAISIKDLFFLGELCNNSLRKLIDIINN